MERSLANGLRKFDKEILFKEVSKMIRFYQEADILDNVDLDYRIKREDSCIRKYNKFYLEMKVEKVFNDILGFRMLADSYSNLLNDEIPEEVRVVDMSHGKANDDGYRGVLENGGMTQTRELPILSREPAGGFRDNIGSFHVCI